MSDEQINDDSMHDDESPILDNNIKKPEESQEKEHSEFEKICIDRGWDPNGELSAKDWDENGWKVKNKKLDSLFQTVEKLKNKLVRQEQESYERARAKLEAERIEAIEMADVQRVKEIEEHQKSLSLDPSVKEHIDAFITKHQTWLQGSSFTEREMQEVCKLKDTALINQKLPLEQHFQKLEEYMIERYPAFFIIFNSRGETTFNY